MESRANSEATVRGPDDDCVLNVEKYPPSLQYLLMTVGPGFIALALMSVSSARFFVILGRVPLFFYVLHLYVINTMALVVARITGQSDALALMGRNVPRLPPAGYGLGLPGVYAAWIVAMIVLYACCRWGLCSAASIEFRGHAASFIESRRGRNSSPDSVERKVNAINGGVRR